MALVVGPKQNVAPMKTSATSNDQCSRSSHGCRASRTVISALTWCDFSQTGTSRKITVYTTKFASGGRFDTTGVSFAVQLVQRQPRHGSRRTVDYRLRLRRMVWAWRIQRRRGSGRLIHRADGRNETLFGFVAVSTSTGDITSGNLLDAVQFRHVLIHGLPNPAKRQRHLQHGRRNTGRVRQRGLEKRLRAGRQRRDRHRQTGRRQPPHLRRVCSATRS